MKILKSIEEQVEEVRRHSGEKRHIALLVETADDVVVRTLQRIEEARSARWDTSIYPAVDQLVATNFPDKVVTLQTTGAGVETIAATIKTEISDISLTPPVRRIRVDCIWLFKGVEPVTNSIETCRAPDQ